MFYLTELILRMFRHTREISIRFFKKYALFTHLNVYDNIAFGLNLKKVDKAEIKERVTEMLRLCESCRI